MKKSWVAWVCAVLPGSAAMAQSIVQQAAPLAHDITVRSMFEQADWVVKSVMLILTLASVATLSIWIAKMRELLASRRSLADSIRALTASASIEALAGLPDHGVGSMVEHARHEASRYPHPLRLQHSEGIKERAAALIQGVQAAELRRLSRGVSILGSIGAAAPFIGLFGTVWGIMNSFIGIAKAQTTNLAVVAPGIAEALLATACGLVAAIPAVLAYNAIARAIAGERVRMNDAATRVMCLLGRDLELGASSEHALVVEARRGVQA
ncbi:tonB-system energizer ExbB [Peristeroidobacter soli]|uniref:tonB-system energizer ExbB n=1 Tax=Peristeroidobacter soli TaxID=2497877 RepID=UPI00101D693E|nr:tonB-system energizer ExbB [Peristeroidobacter soli]